MGAHLRKTVKRTVVTSCFLLICLFPLGEGCAFSAQPGWLGLPPSLCHRGWSPHIVTILRRHAAEATWMVEKLTHVVQFKRSDKDVNEIVGFMCMFFCQKEGPSRGDWSQ